VQFTDISTNNPTSWNWTISPATGVIPSSSTSQNPNICFNTPGSYDVTLEVSNAIGAGIPLVKSAFIIVNNCPPNPQNPHAAFWVSRNFICANDCIHFTDLSTNNPTSWSWTFDGAAPNNSNVQYPTGICYSSPGIYDVELIVSNSIGADTSHITAYIVVGLCNGVNDMNDAETLVVYPNPFNKDFTITTESNFPKGKILIYDMMGKEVKNFELSNEKIFRVNVPELSAGIYSLNIIYSNGESVQKRVIKME
jgi:PKD repeat protein